MIFFAETMISSLLYLSNQPVQQISLLDADYASPDMLRQVAYFLGCSPRLVDVLAADSDYVVYSIFDYEGIPNVSAMLALSQLTGIMLSPDDADECLMGPILIVSPPPPLPESKSYDLIM